VHSDRPSAAERSPSVRQAHCVRVDTHLEHGKRQRRHLVEVHVLKVFERPDHVSMPFQTRLIAADMVTAPAQLGGMIDAGFVIAGFYGTAGPRRMATRSGLHAQPIHRAGTRRRPLGR